MRKTWFDFGPALLLNLSAEVSMRLISLVLILSFSLLTEAKEKIPACDSPSEDFCMGAIIAEQSYFEKNIINVNFPVTTEHFSVRDYMPTTKMITVEQAEPIFHNIFYPQTFAVFGHTFFTSSAEHISAAEKKLKAGGSLDVSFVTFMKKQLILNRDKSYCWIIYQMYYEVYVPELQLMEKNIPFGKGDTVQVKISPNDCQTMKKNWE
jgi:hypothetical protein